MYIQYILNMKRILFLTLALFLTCTICISFHANAYANVFTRLSQTIASENHVYVEWNRVSNGTYSIMFAHSSDNGNTFGNAVKIVDDVGFGMPQISDSTNNVYIAWDIDDGKHHGIFLKKSINYGNTFEPAILLSNKDQLCSSLRGLETAGSNVYVFFSCYNSIFQQGSIVFRVSHDNATTFGKPITLFEGKGISSNGPFWVSVQGKNIYAIIEDSYPVSAPDSVLFRRSMDGGDTFSDTVDLSNSKYSHVNPQVFSSENHVYVTWRNYDNYYKDLMFRKSDDYGTTFGNPIKLNTNKPNTEMYNNPFLEIIDNKIYVSWEEIRQGYVQTQYQLLRTSTNYGDEFGPEQKLTDVLPQMGYNLQQGGIVTGPGQNVYYLYHGTPNLVFDISGVFFKKSSDGAKTFGDTLDLNKLNSAPHDMYDPQITVSKNDVYVTADTLDRGNEIFFVSSHDNGTVFGKVININNYDSGITKVRIDSPLQQLRSGIKAQNIKCNTGLELVVNSKAPACVRHVSLPRLLSHGWVYGIDDNAETASKKTQEIITIGNKIPNSGGLVPVIVTEVTDHAELLDSITNWDFLPIGLNGDNIHKTWEILPVNYSKFYQVVDKQENNIIDHSRMSEPFGVTLELRMYPSVCGSQKIVGEGGHPLVTPIKKGISTVFAKNADKGLLPDSNGEYTLEMLSLFETKLELPKGIKIISNQTESCFLEYKFDNFTKSFYTKAVFKLD
jgi:hypothetical protein